MVNVAVVGAGFAGLAASLELHDAGVPVVVLEARERVGGRVLSVELENGELAELGAEWIMPDDDVLQATIDRLGLTASEAGIDYLRREPRGRSAVPMAELDAFLEAADAHLAASDADGSSMGAMLDAVPGDDRARAVAKARLQGTFASDLERVAWRAGWHSGRLAAEPAVYRRMARGNGIDRRRHGRPAARRPPRGPCDRRRRTRRARRGRRPATTGSRPMPPSWRCRCVW